MESIFEKYKINMKIFRFIIACKKSLIMGLVTLLAVSSLLQINAFAASDMVDISIEVKREVITLPDLYEHLLLTLKTGKKADGSDAVLVLQRKMNLIGSEQIPIGQVEMGGFLYVFFDITLDGAETTNAYQGSKVATSYVFYSRSDKKLTIFKTVSKTGNVFEEMKNLNPGDKFTGVMCLDPGTEVEVSTTGTTYTNPPNTEPSYTNPPNTNPPYTNPPYTEPPYTNPPYTNPEQTTVPEYTTNPVYPTNTTEPTTNGGTLPVTNDTSPIAILIALSALFAVLLIIQLIFLKKSKNKKEI